MCIRDRVKVYITYVGQGDKTLNTSSINESNNTDDSGIQTTPKSNRENKNNDNEVGILSLIHIFQGNVLRYYRCFKVMIRIM